MTPVDATSTSSASQPSARAVSAAISSATLRPASPVQAFAQPLLTTIARAWPPVAARWSRDTTIGAATALFTVKTPAALDGRPDATMATSPAFGLDAAMHACAPEIERCVDTSLDRGHGSERHGAVSSHSTSIVRLRATDHDSRGRGFSLPSSRDAAAEAARVATQASARPRHRHDRADHLRRLRQNGREDLGQRQIRPLPGWRRAQRSTAKRKRHRKLRALAELRAAAQSVAIFSGNHWCGTIEKPRRTKWLAWCVKAHSVEKPS